MKRFSQSGTGILPVLFQAGGENNAITCLLIHPTDGTDKLETKRHWIQAVRGHDTRMANAAELAKVSGGPALLPPTVHGRPDGSVGIMLNLKSGILPHGLSRVLENRPGAPALTRVDAAGWSSCCCDRILSASANSLFLQRKALPGAFAGPATASSGTRSMPSCPQPTDSTRKRAP